MRVITFYSYKGGVGRTLACANFGLYLAKAGQKVVLIDFDLEAPGLDSKFFPDAATRISQGLLDQVSAFQNGSPLPNLSPIPILLSDEIALAGGDLKLLPAGNYHALDTYHRAVSNLNWDYLLNSERGLAFWYDLLLRIEKQFKPNVVVIDSRTGITEVGGLCTQILPDMVLMMSSTSPESMAGTRRIYEKIKNSRLIKEGRGLDAGIDIRVVLTRVPRQEDAEAFDRKMKPQFPDVPRLYYLFADGDLATSEFLAMQRPERAEIVNDYVNLFASLNPEDTAGYINSRLASFREGLTLRKEAESRRVIQELTTLFPRAEVYLEAARYYRLVKEYEESITNYLKYLKTAPEAPEILSELVEVCVLVPLASISERNDAILHHLVALGPKRMDAAALSLFCSIARSPEQVQSIVETIEEDPAKLTAKGYRSVLFRALTELQEWDKLISSATDIDLKDSAIQRNLAKAHAKLHQPAKALQVLHRLPLRDLPDFLQLMEILYDLRADAEPDELRRVIKGNRHMSSYFGRYASGLVDHPSFSKRNDKEFRAWVRELSGDLKNGQ